MRSIVSDTWSTDVLASDSEPPEQNQYDRLEEIGEEIVRQSLLARNEVSQGEEIVRQSLMVGIEVSQGKK